MRMPSKKEVFRRDPRQERSGLRIEQILDAAAEVMASRGNEAATMTEIAEKARASIGTVYQYFPNKEAVIAALRSRYGDDMESRLTDLHQEASHLSVKQIAERLIVLTIDFIDKHPAYFHVFDGAGEGSRSKEARLRLREKLAALLELKRPEMPRDSSLIVAEICVQIIKSINPLYVQANAKRRRDLAREYKVVLSSYLVKRMKYVEARVKDSINPGRQA